MMAQASSCPSKCIVESTIEDTIEDVCYRFARSVGNNSREYGTWMERSILESDDAIASFYEPVVLTRTRGRFLPYNAEVKTELSLPDAEPTCFIIMDRDNLVAVLTLYWSDETLEPENKSWPIPGFGCRSVMPHRVSTHDV